MITSATGELEQGEEFQRIRAGIKNTLNLPVDNLDKPSGVPTVPNLHAPGLGQDDLVTIFRRMLDVGSPDYEHGLSHFLHNGPPNMDYVWIDKCDNPDTRTSDDLLVAAVANRVKAEREAVDRANKTLVVAKKEDLNVLDNEKFDFQCYIPDCCFVTNFKSAYERHVVTKHPGKLCYPGKVDLKQRGWTAQGRKWEI